MKNKIWASIFVLSLSGCGSGPDSGTKGLNAATGLPAEFDGTYYSSDLSHPVPEYRKRISFSTAQFYKDVWNKEKKEVERRLDRTDLNISFVEKENSHTTTDVTDVLSKFEGETGVRPGKYFRLEGASLVANIPGSTGIQGPGGLMRVELSPAGSGLISGKKTVFKEGTGDVLYREDDLYKKF